MKKQQKAFKKAWNSAHAKLKSGQIDCEQAGLAMWEAALSQPCAPVAVVTCEGVVGVRFTEACDYSTSLAVGTELYTRPSAAQDVPVNYEVTDANISIFMFAPRGAGGFSYRPASGVCITHLPTGIEVVHAEDRSVHKNKAIAMDKLKKAVEAAKNKVVEPTADPIEVDESFLTEFFDRLMTGDFTAGDEEDQRQAIRARAMMLNQLQQEGKGSE